MRLTMMICTKCDYVRKRVGPAFRERDHMVRLQKHPTVGHTEAWRTTPLA